MMYNAFRHNFYLVPFQLIAYIVIVITEMSWVGLFMPILIIIMIACQGKVALIFMKTFSAKFGIADKRSKKVNEAVTGIKVIKFNAWEDVIRNTILQIRKAEKPIIKSVIFMRGMMETMMKILPGALVLGLFPLYNGVIDPMTVAKTYSLITIFKLINGPVVMLQWSITMFSQAKASMERLAAILNLPEAREIIQKDDTSLPVGKIEIADGNFSWKDIELMKIMKDKDIPKKEQ